MATRLLTLFVTCILASSVLMSQKPRDLTVGDIYGTGAIRLPSYGSVEWLQDGQRYVRSEWDEARKAMDLVAYDIRTDSRTVLLDGTRLTLPGKDGTLRFTAFDLSEDESRALLIDAPPDKQYLSRLTPAGNIYLYVFSTGELKQLTDVAVEQWNQKFAPDQKTVALVRENDIYEIDVSSGTERRITADGGENIINGKFDWVYEEEFGISDGIRYSPDGRYLAYWRLDQSRVPEFAMVDHADLHGSTIRMRYPKAGDQNSAVAIRVVDRTTGRTVSVRTGEESDIYLPRIYWNASGNRLFVARLNRQQNHLEFLAADPSTGETRVVFSERSPSWIAESYSLIRAGKEWVTLSERDGYSHIYLLDSTLGMRRQVTTGQWDVSRVLGVDEAKGRIYFQAAMESPLESHLYVVSTSGRGLTRLTEPGFSHQVSLSPTFSYIIDTHSSLSSPPETKLLDGKGAAVRTLATGGTDSLRGFALGRSEFFSFTTSDSVALNGWMMRPHDFDPAKTYPVLFFVYGGPGSQTVRNAWGGPNALWHHLLTQRGYIVVSVDGRGTGARGKRFRDITYRKLGTWEVNDQREAARYIGSLPYVDATRIGIWGWSYGGYMASLTILKGAAEFSTAIAVAPVTHWKFYDTIYTERYMGTPQDNPEGYAESAPLTHAGLLRGKLLLVHGTTDDNVHWQNTVQFVDALQREDKQFSTMFYQNRNHGIRGGNARHHLFTMMTDFILQNL